jgi:hypothetical protein
MENTKNSKEQNLPGNGGTNISEGTSFSEAFEKLNLNQRSGTPPTKFIFHITDVEVTDVIETPESSDNVPPIITATPESLNGLQDFFDGKSKIKSSHLSLFPLPKNEDDSLTLKGGTDLVYDILKNSLVKELPTSNLTVHFTDGQITDIIETPENSDNVPPIITATPESLKGLQDFFDGKSKIKSSHLSLFPLPKNEDDGFVLPNVSEKITKIKTIKDNITDDSKKPNLK